MNRSNWLSAYRGRRSRGRRAGDAAFRVARASLEGLEARAVPAMIVVQTTGDARGAVTGTDGLYSAPTLRAAVDFANINAGEDTITFAPSIAGGTIGLASNDTLYPVSSGGATGLVITDDLNIVGGASRGMTVDGLGQRRILAVTAGASLDLQNLTLTNGRAQGGTGGAGLNGGGGGAGMGGAIYAVRATVSLTGCTLSDNVAQGGLGGSSTYLANPKGGGGGGGSTSFEGGTGSSISLGGGGGGGTDGPGSDAEDRLGGAGGEGGANVNGDFSAANVKGSLGGGGGGGTSSKFVSHSGGGATSVNPSGFGGGGGGGAGGAKAFGNANGGNGGFGAGGGGGGYKGSGGDGGFGAGGGGGVGGIAPGYGIYGGGDGGQSAQGSFGGGGGGGGAGLGGAIFLLDSTLSLTNSTVASNQALGGQGGTGVQAKSSVGGGRLGAINPVAGEDGSGLGGGVFATGKSNVVSSNCTIADNVGLGQVVITTTPGAAKGASLTLRNTVVLGPSGSVGPEVIVRGVKGARAPKVYGFNNFLGRVGRIPRAIVVGRGDPMLGTLADNGGPTRTILPRSGSPLINAGRNARRGPATDQRGLPRLVGTRVDIGAVELS